jgi:hypothetical protein
MSIPLIGTRIAIDDFGTGTLPTRGGDPSPIAARPRENMASCSALTKPRPSPTLVRLDCDRMGTLQIAGVHAL